MAPKVDTKKKDSRKSVVVFSDKIGATAEEIEGAEEIEIAAQISVPTDGGWGWVVLAAGFFCLFILDGQVFTYGSLLPDISKNLEIEHSLTATINSVETGLYFISSPLASGLINRFGFRTVSMVGSILCCFGLFASYFTNGFVSLLIFFGFVNGVGCSLISMSSSLIVGFYFEKLRALALAIVTGGASLGVTVMYPLNVNLVRIAGWRSTVLLHSGLHGLIYFLSLTFRPVLSLTVTQTEDRGEPSRTVTYLPSLARVKTATTSRAGIEVSKITPAERLFSAVSSHYFPTAAAVMHENIDTPTPQTGPSATESTGPSKAAVSRITLSAQGTVSRRQLNQMRSMVSRSNFQNKSQTNIEITIQVEERKKTNCCGKLCNWEADQPEARPLYRDDVFYDGNLEKLPQYQKSVMEVPKENRTGLEYQLAVTRAVTVNDLQERRGVFTTAVRRVLATMLNPTLLKKGSFLLLCLSGFLTYAGVLVPYVFIQDRNLKAGVDPFHCTYFVSALSLANVVGRLVLSAISMKLEPIKVYTFAIIVAGASTMLSTLSYNLVYQYLYCIIFGFFISAISCVRSLVIVSLYGLENLTNASGIVIMCLGFGNLFSTPLAGVIKENFGYEMTFYVSGCFIVLGGVVSIPMKCISNKENTKDKDAAHKRPSTAAAAPMPEIKRVSLDTPESRKAGASDT